MHQYWYLNSKGSEQLYKQISVPPFYLQPHMSQLEGTNGLRSPDGWSGRVYQSIWSAWPWGGRMQQPINWTSQTDQIGLTPQESSSGWTIPADNKGFSSYDYNGNSMLPVDHDDWESQEQPVIWPKLPEHPGFGTQTQPTVWTQPHNNKGMMTQGYQASWAPSAGNKSFISQKQLLPWAQPINNMETFSQGHPSSLMLQSAIPFGFGANGYQQNWGGFGTPAGWGGQANPMGWGVPAAPMGWGNNQGKGLPGILGGLLKVGKGTMNGIGMISSLIGVGKFLF